MWLHRLLQATTKQNLIFFSQIPQYNPDFETLPDVNTDLR